MKNVPERGCSRRERLEVTGAALIPAALGLLRPTVRLAGRLSWLGPVLALPVGICLCRIWGKLGERSLSRGLEQAFGGRGGKGVAGLYFLWGLALLTDGARRYSDRLLSIFEGETTRWLFLLGALAVALWLGKGKSGAFARAERIFFLAVVVTLTAILLLAVPGIDGRNLWPPEGTAWRGLPGGGALCLSLAGYGVYALCLPRRSGDEMEKTWPWAAWGCGLFAALLFVITGVFGPALVGEMEDPFFYLLEGVQVPGAFRRGEAGLMAVLTLADLVLLTLLSRGCMSLWRELVPVFPGAGCVPVAVAFGLAGALSGMGRMWGRLEAVLPAGNLILGVLIPAVAILTIKSRERQRARSIFCGEKTEIQEDVAVKTEEEKSNIENEKKC